MAEIAGSAVSSPATSCQDAPRGRYSTPAGATTPARGPMVPMTSPTPALSAHAEAGPWSPCRTKSTSTSPASGRCARIVYVRMIGRTSSGIAW